MNETEIRGEEFIRHFGTIDMTDVLTHISERSWSDYTSADYTLEEWHKACLIHIHNGAPTSKSQCKLPVRTPNGAINRNGVHAAAAALAGARSEIIASDAQKESAAKKLRSLYSELDEEPPNSLKQSDIVIEHFGTRGMKWGVRKDKKIRVDSEDYQKFKTNRKKKSSELSDKELKDTISRMNMNKQMKNLSPSKVKQGHNATKEIIALVGTIGVVTAWAKSDMGKKVTKYIGDQLFKSSISDFKVNVNP